MSAVQLLARPHGAPAAANAVVGDRSRPATSFVALRAARVHPARVHPARVPASRARVRVGADRLPAALLCACVILCANAANARTGMGDPIETWREKEADDVAVFHGHLRLRGAGFANLDLDRGAASDGSVLWPSGITPLDLTGGSDMRVRLAPSFWLGDSGRVFLEIDLLDNVALGARPRFTPFTSPALVAASPFQEPLGALDGAFKVRTAMGEVLLPFGVLSAGRMPSHFGLGIAANDGNDVDDDLGDRADRLAFTLPIFGHIVSAAYDVGATGPSGQTLPGLGPSPRSFLVSEQSVSLALLKFRAPWEVEMLRSDDRVVVDYGVALSYEWQDKDVPGFYTNFDQSLGLDENAVVERGYKAGLVDGWFRVVFPRVRLETELLAAGFTIQNPSPFAGVTLREPISGFPWGGDLVVEFQPLPDREFLSVLLETGVASSDPAPGLPLPAPTSLSGAQPGDVFGPQIDGKRDARQDGFRLHPLHRVDLILWRTLLGGVSEAAFARAHATFAPAQASWDGLKIEGNVIYSHALDAGSAPGGVAPLGVEVDAAVVVPYDAFSLRVDAGVLFPLGGLGARGGENPNPAGMVLMRLAYAL